MFASHNSSVFHDSSRIVLVYTDGGLVTSIRGGWILRKTATRMVVQYDAATPREKQMTDKDRQVRFILDEDGNVVGAEGFNGTWERRRVWVGFTSDDFYEESQHTLKLRKARATVAAHAAELASGQRSLDIDLIAISAIRASLDTLEALIQKGK
jgi:hypothetical protein